MYVAHPSWELHVVYGVTGSEDGTSPESLHLLAEYSEYPLTWWLFAPTVKPNGIFSFLTPAVLCSLLPPGSGYSQENSPHHRHRSWPSPSQQIHRISPGQRTASEGVSLQTHPVPQKGFCSQEGRQHCKILFHAFTCKIEDTFVGLVQMISRYLIDPRGNYD